MLMAKNCLPTAQSVCDKKLRELLLPAEDDNDDESSETA